MNRKIVRLLWPPRRLMGVAVGVVGVVLLAVSIAGALHGSPPPDTAGPKTAVAGASSETSPSSNATGAASSPPASQSEKPSTQKQTGTSQTQAATTAQTTTAPPPNTQPSTIEVSLTINNTYKGKVSLPTGSNQCDVLQQALKDGIINDLTIKYSPAMQSNGVYIIDGLGDANIVWWTYKVNDKGPPAGCSKIAAHQGDAIKWEYVKN